MIFYLHIPKTGGLTLAYRLSTAFVASETYDQTRVHRYGLTYPKGVETLRSLAKTKQFVESHIGGGVLGDFHDLDIMVTVRDPVERILSFWRHILRDHTKPMHRVANKLHYCDFFDRFGDYFTDGQSRYFVGSFFRIGEQVQKIGHHHAVLKNLFDCIDRIRWFIPTENIDEFIELWSLETKRWVPNATRRVNVSTNSPDNKDDILDEAREYLRKRTELYSLDLLLYQIAREKFSAYRADTIRSQGINPYADNSRRSFVSGDSAIWLSENWHDAIPTKKGEAWWAGPKLKSVVHVRRAGSEKYLRFDVVTVNGVRVENILVCDKNLATPLPTRRVRGDSHCKFSVDLDSLGREDDIAVLVPECKAAVRTDRKGDKFERQSFASANWSLSNDPIG